MPRSSHPARQAELSQSCPQTEAPPKVSRKARIAAAVTGSDARNPDARWRSLFGSEPPRSQTLVAQATAWKEQVLAHGDVSPAVRRDLSVAAAQVCAARGAGSIDGVHRGGGGRDGGVPPLASLPALPPATSQLAPGTRLVKSHGGHTHVVEVTAAGMLYEGELYASLSAVAKAITGTHWNGLLFFGLRKRRVYPAKAAAHG